MSDAELSIEAPTPPPCLRVGDAVIATKYIIYLRVEGNFIQAGVHGGGCIEEEHPAEDIARARLKVLENEWRGL